MGKAADIFRTLIFETKSFGTMLDLGKLLTEESIVNRLKEVYGYEEVLIIRKGLIFAIVKVKKTWFPIKDDVVPIKNAIFNDLLGKREYWKNSKAIPFRDISTLVYVDFLKGKLWRDHECMIPYDGTQENTLFDYMMEEGISTDKQMPYDVRHGLLTENWHLDDGEYHYKENTFFITRYEDTEYYKYPLHHELTKVLRLDYITK